MRRPRDQEAHRERLRLEADFDFCLRYHAREGGRAVLMGMLEQPSFYSLPGHALVMAMPYADNVASADRVLASAEKAGVLLRMGPCWDHSTQAFLALERHEPTGKTFHRHAKGQGTVTAFQPEGRLYPREYFWRLTERGQRFLRGWRQ